MIDDKQIMHGDAQGDQDHTTTSRQNAEFLLRLNAGERNFDGADLRGLRLSPPILASLGLDLSGTSFKEADLGKAHLIGIDLSEANLSGANLHDAFLTRANLSNCNLAGADLTWAGLSDANLRGANLFGANLSGACLFGADLTSARAWVTQFNTVTPEQRANDNDQSRWRATYSLNLHRTILSRTEFWETVFPNVDFSSTVLDGAEYLGPCYVGLDTLRNTAAGLARNPVNQGPVETFFRGCGLTEGDIAYFRSLIGKPIDFYSAFISHNHADKPFARQLYDALKGRGIRCWLDEKDLRIGDNLYPAINRAIRTTDRLILCCSEESLNSEWVEAELDTAFRKEKEQGHPIILPLDLDGYLFDGWMGVEATKVRKRLASSFKGWETDNSVFEREFERVVAALRADEGGQEVPPDPRL